MPAAFIRHGSPLNPLERNRDTDAWRVLGGEGPAKRDGGDRQGAAAHDP